MVAPRSQMLKQQGALWIRLQPLAPELAEVRGHADAGVSRLRDYPQADGLALMCEFELHSARTCVFKCFFEFLFDASKRSVTLSFACTVRSRCLLRAAEFRGRPVSFCAPACALFALLFK